MCIIARWWMTSGCLWICFHLIAEAQRYNFLSWCQLTEKGSVFQQEHPQFCKPLAHINSLAAHWARLETGYLLSKIKVYFLWETLNLFTAISRGSSFPLWITVWGHTKILHCSCGQRITPGDLPPSWGEDLEPSLELCLILGIAVLMLQ